MNVTSGPASSLGRALADESESLVELVDDLLILCPEQGVQADWQDERCRIRSLSGSTVEVVDRPLRKSVFRAMVARVATLCNERHPDSVSPYGGRAELATNGGKTLQASFVNTPSEQWLRLQPVSTACDGTHQP